MTDGHFGTETITKGREASPTSGCSGLIFVRVHFCSAVCFIVCALFVIMNIYSVYSISVLGILTLFRDI